jgi:hypothetical protein
MDERALQSAAVELGCELAAVKAVAETESSGGAFLPDGRPVIRFEGHVFTARTGRRFRHSHPQVSTDHWKDPVTAGRSYDGLAVAQALDETAALESCSWGQFQTMGFHWELLGYDSVQDLVAAAQTEDGQLAMFVRWIRAHPRAHQALRAKDWQTFEDVYNGGGQGGAYARRMAVAYQKYRSGGASARPLLTEGASGLHVTALQTSLNRHGFDLLADGQFGPHTKVVVQAFQRSRKPPLTADGMVGPATWAALAAPASPKR